MRRFAQWGWMMGTVVVVAISPLMWTESRASSYPRNVKQVSTPRPSPTFIARGRMGFYTGPADWSQPLSVQNLRLGMSLDAAQRSVNFEKYWKRSTFHRLQLFTYNYDPLTKFAVRNDKIVAIAGRDLSQKKVVLASEMLDDKTILNNLGEPDQRLHAGAGDVWSWDRYPQAGYIKWYRKSNLFVLSASENSVF